MPYGIIVKGIGGFYYVKVDQRVYECKARGIFRKEEMSPLPGDKVKIAIVDEEKGLGSLEEILQRQSQLIRPSVANVDQVVVVIAAKSPSPDFMLLDKLLITAEIKGIQPAVCINKTDLDEAKEYEKIIRTYSGAGYRVIPVSTVRKTGFEELRSILDQKVTVFAGQSGVGKSTILNHLMDESLMETGEVSRKIERGRHTTRHAELIELETGGYVVDTPGFSSFELADLTYDTLELYYPEFESYLNTCKFTGCSHITEPGCKVKEALENGTIDQERYERYIQLYTVLKQEKEYRKKGK
ncbi:MAG: ribosome small subunit-dependent GTPase A [Clostridia bacterium]|nr:ribosome small subunit-dependent GTPase A [Clostridia bacterium]